MKRFILIINLFLFTFSVSAGESSQMAHDVHADYSMGKDYDEASAVEQFRLHSPDFHKLNNELLLAEANAQKAGLFKNPRFSYEREQLYPDSGNASEDVMTLSFPIDLSGRKRMLRQASEIVLNSENNRVAWQIHFLESDFKALFYELLWAQKYHQILKEQTTQFSSVLDSIRSRKGKVKDYDRIRLEKKYAEVRSHYKEFSLKVHALKSELIKWFNNQIDHDLFQAKVALLPDAILPDKDSFMQSVPEHPQILSALHQSQADEIKKRAARRRWLPEIEVTGGYKQERASGNIDAGFVVGVSLPLPLFDRGQADMKQAEAVEEISLHELQAVRNDIAMLLDEAYEDYTGFKEITREYERTSLSYAEKLKQMAGVSYLEGNIGVLELIDAYDSYTDAHLRLLTLSLKTRLAFISLSKANPHLEMS